MTRHQSEFPLLRDCRKNENAFHPGEGFSDALACAGPEWEIRKFQAPSFGLGSESIRIKAQRVREKSCIAMGDELAYQDGGSGRKKILPQGKVIARVPSHGPRWRIQAQRFCQHVFGVPESRNIFD
jgi:hypothetical protein